MLTDSFCSGEVDPKPPPPKIVSRADQLVKFLTLMTAVITR